MTTKQSKRHELLEAIRILSTIVQFSERKFDFSSDDGIEILKEAKAACQCLEREIQLSYPED